MEHPIGSVPYMLAALLSPNSSSKVKFRVFSEDKLVRPCSGVVERSIYVYAPLAVRV